MLNFYSASTRMVNSKRAMKECFDAALGETESHDCDLLIIHASMGHDFKALVEEAREQAPNAEIVGSSCCGIIGTEGVSESMKDVAIMAIKGKSKELDIVKSDNIYGHNSFEKAEEMARQLKEKNPEINMISFLASGIDIANDHCIEAIESVFGPEVTIFGATSSDNMKGIVSYQFFDDAIFEHGAFMIGFADSSLKVITRATHGFVAVGSPMTVTRSEGNCIIELNGEPAWKEFTNNLGLAETSDCGDSIPIGALAEELSEDLAQEYGNPHILRAVTKKDELGRMYYPTLCPEGTKLWLTKRDEDRIFSELDRMVANIVVEAKGARPVAVFHADCLARGKSLFNRILKDELVSRMQVPLSIDGNIPPWLGMYGFGEFARLGGINTYHNYTTALYVIYREL